MAEVAQIGLGVGGFLAGNALAPGIGGQVGFLAGSALGGILFGPSVEDVVQRGPELGATPISTSTYGTPIPKVFGTDLMAGNLIWTSQRRKVENRTEIDGGGGKGAPSQPDTVQITFSYFIDFAMAFSEGVADKVLQLYFNNQLVYDRTNATGPVSTKPGLKFSFYRGTEDQEPDSTIEADKGVGMVPAHRGMCYIVFKNLDVTEYGGTYPQVTAVISYDANDVDSLRDSVELPSPPGYQTDEVYVDRKRNRVFLRDGTTMRLFDLRTLNEFRRASTPSFFGNQINVGQETGRVYGFDNAVGSNSRPILVLDPDTFQQIDSFGQGSAGINMSVGATKATGNWVAGNQIIEVPFISVLGTGRDYAIVARSLFHDLGIANSDGLMVRAENYSFDFGDSFTILAGRSAVGEAEAYLIGRDSGDILLFHKITITEAIGVDPVSGLPSSGITAEVELVASIDTTADFSTSYTLSSCEGAVYDKLDDSYIVTAGVTGGQLYFKWNETDGIKWETFRSQPSIDFVTESEMFNVEGGVFSAPPSAGTGEPYLLDITDGSEIYTGPDDLDTLNGGSVGSITAAIFDGRTQSYLYVSTTKPLFQVFIGRGGGNDITHKSIVDALTDAVGLDSQSDVNTTQLTDTLRGFVVGRQTSTSVPVQQLSELGFFDGVEEDDLIFYRARGGASVRTIDEDDLVQLSESDADIITETRVQEVELPVRVNVQYKDVTRDYEPNVGTAKRVLSPTASRTMSSRNERTLSAGNVVFNGPDEPAKIAEKLLYSRWAERVSVQFRLPWEHLDLSPSDPIVLSLNDGTTLRVRLARFTINDDLTVSCEAIVEDAHTAVSTATGGGGEDFPQQTPPGPSDTKLFLFDINLLQDVDDMQQTASRFYGAMAGFTDGWPGATLWVSEDGVTFSNTGVSQNAGVTYGTIVNALPDTELPFQTDEETQLQIFLAVGGPLASVTQSQFLNNEQAALVFNSSVSQWEIILYRDAVLETDGSYTLSTIMRGRRGTEVWRNGHTAGETIVFLDRTKVFGRVLDTAKIGATRYFKPVANGSFVELAETSSFSHSGNDLKPYAPVHPTATEDGGNNIDFTWERRTRVGGDLKNLTGNIPLAEGSESYELDVLDMPGGTVLRTLASSTTSVQYDNADIITDFGVVPANITIQIYQLSDIVGRGHTEEYTIPVN